MHDVPIVEVPKGLENLPNNLRDDRFSNAERKLGEQIAARAQRRERFDQTKFRVEEKTVAKGHQIPMVQLFVPKDVFLQNPNGECRYETRRMTYNKISEIGQRF